MGSRLPEGLFFDLVRQDEVKVAYELEKTAFPPEEAASLESFITRQSVAPELFLGAYTPTSPRTLVGYANATLASSSTLTAESMHEHDPTGTSICIHAIAVVESNRRNGIARALLKQYIHRLQDNPTVGTTRANRILLICHENLIPLYKSIGFSLERKSPVVHGPQEWFEMRFDLECEHQPESQPSLSQPSITPDILTALTNPSRNRPFGRLYSSFLSPQDLISASGENALDILCPRCGSIVLKAEVAKYQRGPSVELEPASHTPTAPLQALPPPPSEIDWWLVTPSPMAFENIAFSRPVPSLTAAVPKIKLLACAECDLGAFGWSKEGGNEFWLAASRVGYR